MGESLAHPMDRVWGHGCVVSREHSRNPLDTTPDNWANIGFIPRGFNQYHDLIRYNAAMRSRTIHDITQQDNTLARLTAQAHALLKMDRQFRKMLPETVAAACHAVRIEDGELLIFAENGLIAARLRMIAPGLLPQLAALGYPATRVRIKVELHVAPPPREKRLKISQSALDGIESAAAECIKNPLISEALARLIAHHRE